METIYKYKLKVEDRQIVKMPINAEILCVQIQHDLPCLWVKLNPEKKETESRIIETFGTGHPIKTDFRVERKYIGTYQLNKGVYVFHVFESCG